MFEQRLIGLLLGALVWTSSARAQEQPTPALEITYEEALALARRQAPTLLAARARAREAQSEVAAAAVRPDNPRVSGVAGPRFGADGTVVDGNVSVRQWLELGGQRGDRIDAARAGAAAARARSDDARRLLLRDVGLAFAEALYWQRRTALARENLRIAEAIARVAARRHQVGAAGGLERSVSALSVVRARSAVERAAAFHNRSLGRIEALLGLPASSGLACRGDLRAVARPQTGDWGERADLRALRADIERAGAEASLGRARRVPKVALGVRYAREEGDDLAQGTVAIELPLFDRGQGQSAVAVARQDRLRAELEASTRAATVQAATAAETAGRLTAAAQQFEESGLETIEQAERLATASYEAGAVDLGDVLALRRELVQAKLDFLELLLVAASARIDHAAIRGALQ